MFTEEDVVFNYSRAQALADGVLIDVSKMAKEAGFKYPVAVTKAVWEHYITWDEQDTKRQVYQDIEGRLWDVLYMLKVAIKVLADSSEELYYKLHVVPRGGRAKKPKQIILKSQFHPGDNGEPVITIMEPRED